MRRSRQRVLGATGIFHKTWHAHDREYPLETDHEKGQYAKQLVQTYRPEIGTKVLLHSFSLMDNHTHETGRALPDEHGSLRDAIRCLGDWMRNAHARFGQWYNRTKQRRGKVAYDRPHTSELEGDDALRRAMFYGDINPVRAKIVKHPAQYRHSSYRFYAYGERSALTQILTEPKWYVALGSTRRQRQRRYRQLVDRYMRDTGLLDDEPRIIRAQFVGTEKWVERRRQAFRDSCPARAGPDPG